jgi:hypothetical protein
LSKDYLAFGDDLRVQVIGFLFAKFVAQFLQICGSQHWLHKDLVNVLLVVLGALFSWQCPRVHAYRIELVDHCNRGRAVLESQFKRVGKQKFAIIPTWHFIAAS